MVRAKDPVTGKFIKSEEITNEPDYKKDIEGKSFAEVATEDSEEKTTAPVETPVEKTEEKPEEKEIEFDPKKFKEEVATEISAKISQETADKIAERLTGKDKATETQKDKYEAYAEKFMEEKGRQPTWFEVAAFIKQEVKEEQKLEQEQQVKQKEEQTKQVQETEKARSVAFNKYLDEQLDDLYKNKRLPVIVDKNNPNDEGVVARKALFQKMMEVNTKRKQTIDPATGLPYPPIYSIKEIYYEHFTPPRREVAGGDAPISAGMRSTGHAPSDEQEINYKDIHKKGFMDLLMGR